MGIQGIGTDIVSVERIREVKRREAFASKILSDIELGQYLGYTADNRKIEFLAGRWAVKEALYKAAPDFCHGKSYRSFTISNDPLGKPYLLSPNFEGKLHITISHEKKYAVAFVIVES